MLHPLGYNFVRAAEISSTVVTTAIIDGSALAGRLGKPHGLLRDLLQASQSIRHLDPI